MGAEGMGTQELGLGLCPCPPPQQLSPAGSLPDPALQGAGSTPTLPRGAGRRKGYAEPWPCTGTSALCCTRLGSVFSSIDEYICLFFKKGEFHLGGINSPNTHVWQAWLFSHYHRGSQPGKIFFLPTPFDNVWKIA